MVDPRHVYILWSAAGPDHSSQWPPRGHCDCDSSAFLPVCESWLASAELATAEELGGSALLLSDKCRVTLLDFTNFHKI